MLEKVTRNTIHDDLTNSKLLYILVVSVVVVVVAVVVVVELVDVVAIQTNSKIYNLADRMLAMRTS